MTAPHKEEALRRILIVGAGQAGLQLALCLQSAGYEVTSMQMRREW